ncbi:hypothetical protein TWF696_007301 [Orbilia brochopaga]|uniref:Uncharacterized protein n=1 Tax=Orbilia brochopaga TaxID=3140254 RepID=A0AAV9URK1_9PEZI
MNTKSASINLPACLTPVLAILDFIKDRRSPLSAILNQAKDELDKMVSDLRQNLEHGHSLPFEWTTHVPDLMRLIERVANLMTWLFKVWYAIYLCGNPENDMHIVDLDFHATTFTYKCKHCSEEHSHNYELAAQLSAPVLSQAVFGGRFKVWTDPYGTGKYGLLRCRPVSCNLVRLSAPYDDLKRYVRCEDGCCPEDETICRYGHWKEGSGEVGTASEEMDTLCVHLGGLGLDADSERSSELYQSVYRSRLADAQSLISAAGHYYHGLNEFALLLSGAQALQAIRFDAFTPAGTGDDLSKSTFTKETSCYLLPGEDHAIFTKCREYWANSNKTFCVIVHGHETLLSDDPESVLERCIPFRSGWEDTIQEQPKINDSQSLELSDRELTSLVVELAIELGCSFAERIRKSQDVEWLFYITLDKGWDAWCSGCHAELKAIVYHLLGLGLWYPKNITSNKNLEQNLRDKVQRIADRYRGYLKKRETEKTGPKKLLATDPYAAAVFVVSKGPCGLRKAGQETKCREFIKKAQERFGIPLTLSMFYRT